MTRAARLVLGLALAALSACDASLLTLANAPGATTPELPPTAGGAPGAAPSEGPTIASAAPTTASAAPSAGAPAGATTPSPAAPTAPVASAAAPASAIPSPIPSAIAHPAGLTPEVTRVALDAAGGSGWPEYPLRADTWLLPRADGGAWLAWNTGIHDPGKEPPTPWGNRLMRLDADLQPVGPSIAGPADMTLAAACAMPGGGFAALAQRRKMLTGGAWPHEAWYVRFDDAGREVARRLIVGKGDRSAGQDFFHQNDAAIAVSGDRVAVYHALFHNYADPGEPDDIHELDLLTVFGPDDEPIAALANRFQAGHSTQMRLTPGIAPGSFWQATVGDGSPYGIVFSNTVTRRNTVVWAPPGPLVHAESAGLLRGFERVGDLAYATLAGAEVSDPPRRGWSELRAPLLLGIDGEGKVRRTRWLDEARQGSDLVTCAPIGADRLLIGWGDFFYPTTEVKDETDVLSPPSRFAIYDPAADAVAVGPAAIDVPISGRAAWATLADGSVAWAVCQAPDRDHATLVRMRPR